MDGPLNGHSKGQLRQLVTEIIEFAWKAWSFAIACVLLLVTLPALSGISGNSEQKTIFKTIKQLIQYTVLETHFWSLKYTPAIRIAKIWAAFRSYPSDTRRLECVDVNNPPQTVFKHVYTVYANVIMLYILTQIVR